MKNITAYTPPKYMPPYVSINAVDAGISITVRGPMTVDANQMETYGQVAEIIVPIDEFNRMLRDCYNHEPTSSKL